MAARPDALLISGDIGVATDVEQHLLLLTELIPVSINFVLGNHDFYRGSIVAVRDRIASLASASSQLTWLSQTGIIPLTEKTCLVGHDSWADARLGDYKNSQVMLNDYKYIAELQYLSKEERRIKLNALGDEAADHFWKTLPDAVKQYQHILVLTHVPPFREACWHEGQISNDDYLPHFSCKAVGEVLVDIMRSYPDRQMTVLCGHTHSSGVVDILPNLRVKTGATVYGKPEIQEILTVE